jgi:hypothetical protein
MQRFHRWEEFVVHNLSGGNVNSRRKNVVARLAAIDVVVRMRPSKMPDNLIRTHVCGCPAAGLENIDDELVIVLTASHFLSRGFNGGDEIRQQNAQSPVDPRRHGFDQSEGTDEGPGKSALAKRISPIVSCSMRNASLVLFSISASSANQMRIVTLTTFWKSYGDQTKPLMSY